jgi:hypothetical protein
VKKLNYRRKEFSFPIRDYHRKHQCVFIHVPKVAGSAILAALGKKKGGRDHLPWFVYYGANSLYFKKAFKFSFVRNPWERTFSSYNYLRNGGNQSSDLPLAQILSRYATFNDFVINGFTNGVLRNHLLFIPQSEFLLKADGSLAVDFLGRYENINEDFELIKKKLNLQTHLTVINNTNRAKLDYKNFYLSDEAIDIVRQIYIQDVMVFNYEY